MQNSIFYTQFYSKKTKKREISDNKHRVIRHNNTHTSTPNINTWTHTNCITQKIIYTHFNTDKQTRIYTYTCIFLIEKKRKKKNRWTVGTFKWNVPVNANDVNQKRKKQSDPTQWNYVAWAWEAFLWCVYVHIAQLGVD